jgi:uncharacterized protein (DUF39 family)
MKLEPAFLSFLCTDPTKKVKEIYFDGIPPPLNNSPMCVSLKESQCLGSPRVNPGEILQM